MRYSSRSYDKTLNRSLNIIKDINENSADDIIFNVEITENQSPKFED